MAKTAQLDQFDEELYKVGGALLPCPHCSSLLARWLLLKPTKNT